MTLPSKDDILSQLSREEKAQLCSGKDFWHLHGLARFGLQEIMVTDGPHGLRKQQGEADHVGLNESVPATCFPTASALAATWNKELLREVGEALGRECRAENVSVLLGPGVNIKRHPHGGRNFEYFSEDPYLSGVMARQWISGVQSQGVGTSLKHYAANNHEYCRMVVDVVMDERTLREIYLPAFEIAVTGAQPWTVMCAYNKLNGTYLAEHEQLLGDILEREWGFEGLVVTDWGANNDRVRGLKAGQALEMPASGEPGVAIILEALEEGRLTEAELDHSVGKVLDLIIKGREAQQCTEEADMEAHHRLARRAAAEACVLLKNDGPCLPITDGQSIAVLGALAQQTRYQGVGSSQIIPYKLEQPLEEFQRAFGAERVSFSEGYSLAGELTAAQVEEALRVAQAAEVVVLVAGLTPDLESEGFDREHMNLPAQQLALIDALAPVHHKLVVVLQNGAPVALPFADKVPAILEAYLGGQAGASALVDILSGAANPGGKLAETFPLRQSDVASDAWFPGASRQSQYRENIWVGYRYFDTAQVPVAFPFGHGLSYTSFEYSDLQCTGAGGEGGALVLGESDTIDVSFDISNTGAIAGAEVAQLYVGQLEPSVHRPVRELKGFEKVFLQPGETRKVTLQLKWRDFAWWSVADSRWVVESGQYRIHAAASVADVRLEALVDIDGGAAANRIADNCSLAPDPAGFSDSAFARLLGGAIPEAVPVFPIHTNSMLGEIKHSWLGRKIVSGIKKKIAEDFGSGMSAGEIRMLETIVEEMPLRNLVMMSQGQMSMKTLWRLVHVMNGNYLKAITGAPVTAR